MNDFPVITVLTLVPFLAGLIAAGSGSENRGLARSIALGSNVTTLGLALVMWFTYDAAAGGYKFEEIHDWIEGLGVQYHVAADGLGLLMVLLTAIVTPMAVLGSRPVFSNRAGAPTGAEHPHLYYALVLFLQAGLFGTFTALNFFHWFLFWELSLVPAFFLVRLWGGARRAAAATRFFIYTMAGSVGLLLSFLAIYLATGEFDFVKITELVRNDRLLPALGKTFAWAAPESMALLIFAGAFAGFAVKVPLMPLHTWLPAAYTEAPAGTTMLLTGALSKMGVYGFLRILLPIFPDQLYESRVPLLVLAVLTIVCSASTALAQRDLKRLLAYSSINHLGYCLLAIFAVAAPAPGWPQADLQRNAALHGVLLQMFNHGLTAATLFWLVGLLEERSGGWRGLEDFGGLRKVAPVFCGLLGIALFSSLGLPGLNGFVGEFLIFKGAFPLAAGAAAVSVLGLLVTAVFILKIMQRVFHGPVTGHSPGVADLSTGERVMLGVPVALMLLLGVHPQLVLGAINGTVARMVEQLGF